jgi:hypothetical protein
VFKCRAENSIGNATAEIQIKEGIRPPKPEKLNLIGYGTDILDLDIGSREGNFDDPTAIKKYRFELIQKDDFESKGMIWKNQFVEDQPARNNVTYKLTNLSPNKTYLVRVASVNDIAQSEWTDIKEFSTVLKISMGERSNANAILSPMLILILTVIIYWTQL